MTNAEFKAAAKKEGVRIYSLHKTRKGYKLIYAYILSEHTVSQQNSLVIETGETLQEIFDRKFAGMGVQPRW